MGRKRRRGGNVLKTIANGIKKGVSVLKKTRLISRIAAPIGAALGAPEMGAQIAGTAGKLGFGRRRRRRGGNSTVKNIVSGIKRGINTLKKTRLVSRIAVPVGEALGHPNAGKSVAQTARKLGFGRRRRRGGALSDPYSLVSLRPRGVRVGLRNTVRY
jgi:hypothetical protein